jgi:(p)ppGpp synthase/HD superfamily hydrolase
VRSEAMAARVLAAALEAGVPRAELPLLERAHRLAMAARSELLDEHAPDLLHPGRTALILLLDTEESTPGVLAAGMLVESERLDLAVPFDAIAKELGKEVAARVEAVPPRGAEDQVERLVTAEESVQRIALAERLDQLRHAHLWPDVERRRAAHEQALDLYSPLAQRVHPKLARRYAWWCTTFARKYLAGPRTRGHC